MNKRTTLLALVLLAAVMAAPAPAQPAARRGSPIRFSAPRQDAATTNLNEFTDASRDNLRKLEEDLGQPLRLLGRTPGTEIFGSRPLPPPGPMIQSKRIRELLDRRKNWVFDTPENQVLGLTGEEMMNLPEMDEQGRDKSKIPVFERFYENLAREREGGTDRAFGGSESRSTMDEAAGRRPFGGSETGPAQDRSDREGLSLPNVFRSDVFEAGVSPGLNRSPTMPDLFNPPPQSAWQVKAQESRLQQFKQMIQPDTPKVNSPGLGGLPASSGLGGLQPGEGPTFSGSRAVTAPGAGSFSGAGLAAAPGLSSPAQPTMTPLPERRLPKSPPVMEIPRRKF